MRLSSKTLVKLREMINEETIYRSGPELIKFFAPFGFKDTYGRDFGARRDYTDKKLEALNGTPDIDRCLKLLFAPIEFVENIIHLDECIAKFNNYLSFDGWRVVRNNTEISFARTTPDVDGLIKKEAQGLQTNIADDGLDIFLKKQFADIDLSKLQLEGALFDVLTQRLKELKDCIKYAPLATILLAGSILEFALLSLGISNRKLFENSANAPKGKKIEEWKLSELIDVAYDIGIIKIDVYKFSSTLRQFRNYIHPHRQLMEHFFPDGNTAHICFHVLKAAIAQINEWL